jgi:hypothetical protein
MMDPHSCRDRALVFTRYPTPGQTKTRLIPTLGAQGAAQLQRQLSEHTLAQVRQLQNLQPVTIEVRFAGGTIEQMRAWLGSDLLYNPQNNGDLGARLIQAFEEAFDAGIERVVTIGIDCPAIDAALLSTAFDRLQDSDLVLGPAVDGGYYLIGLRRPVPELFTGIDWGTGEVLQQTVAIAHSLSLSIDYLPQLRDIDRPEDLPSLPPDFQLSPLPPPISIIIPVLNEADRLEQTLARASAGTPVEIIVVDGGSEDGTRELAEACGVKAIASHACRARQMNAGATVARGEILLFLHGDTQLPRGYDTVVREVLAVPGVVGGAFELKIDSSRRGLRWVERGVKWRSRLLQMPYGDQGIFVRADVFRELGGFSPLPIVEDLEFIHRLRTRGKIAIAPSSVLTSARRWEKLGVVKTTAINQAILIGYYLGVPPERLVNWYGQWVN